MARARLKPDERPPFHIVIDEAQNFGPAVIASLVTEARKFGLSVTIATQFLSGIDQKVRDALLNVVKTLIVFQVGDKDAELLAPEFDRAQQSFNPYALRQLGVGEAMIRISSRGTARIDVDPPRQQCGRAEIVRKQSRIHYGVPRAEVETRSSGMGTFADRYACVDCRPVVVHGLNLAAADSDPVEKQCRSSERAAEATT